MKIHISTVTKNYTEFEVQPDDTIESVKVKLLENEGIPLNHQQLFFKNKQIDNDKKLSDYGIQDGNTIFLYLKLR